MIDIQDVPYLVKHVHEQGIEPRVHPNGFIQLDLVVDDSRIPEYRLHVWPDGDDIPRQDVATLIHDHRFDMESTVLLGGIYQRRYSVTVDPRRPWITPGAPSPFTHEIYVARYQGKESTLEPSGVKVYVVSDKAQQVLPGSTYLQRRYTFHETKWATLSATLLHKLDDDRNHNPRVLVPLGSAPDNTFIRADAPKELLWVYIDRVMDQI